MKTAGNSVKEAMKAHMESHGIQLQSLNWIPVLGHLCDRMPITLQIGAQWTNHDWEFCCKYDQYYNGIWLNCK